MKAVLIYPLQQEFLEIKTVKLVSDYYNSGYSSSSSYEPNLFSFGYVAGFDDALTQALRNTGPYDDQPNLWNASKSSSSSYGYGVSANITSGLQEKLSDPQTSWVAVQNNTFSTGLEASAGLRMNTSVICEDIPKSDYPATCPGSAPWSAEITFTFGNGSADPSAAYHSGIYGLQLDYTDQYIYGMDMQVCVPGNQYSFPWDVSTTRQTLQEELYFDVDWAAYPFNLTYGPVLQNYTRK
jgi:hypothetical protein